LCVSFCVDYDQFSVCGHKTPYPRIRERTTKCTHLGCYTASYQMLKAVSGWSRDAEETYLVEIGKLRRSNERSSIKAMRGKQRVRECDAESHNDQPRSRGVEQALGSRLDQSRLSTPTPTRYFRDFVYSDTCGSNIGSSDDHPTTQIPIGSLIDYYQAFEWHARHTESPTSTQTTTTRVIQHSTDGYTDYRTPND
jgi:hypothetical protein